VGLFTSSGRHDDVEFTRDLSAVEQGLAKLRPHPKTTPCEVKEKFYDAYNAYLTLETGMGVAQASSRVQQTSSGGAQAKAGGAITTPRLDPALLLESKARMTWGEYRITTLGSVDRLEVLVRRLSLMPGQRSIVWISPGFLAMDQDDRLTSLIERALRAHVVISALDSRGAWTPETGIDFCIPGYVLPPPYAQAADLAAGQVLAAVASGTGGILFHDSNDFDAGFRLVGGLPEAAYLLSFSPADMKYDGKFHKLAVQVVNGPGLIVQTRKGYYAPSAPPGSERATTVAEEELEQDVFSQSEVQTVPISLDTQFFKTATDEAKLTVLAHLDVRHLHLEKQNGRNLDHLTVITALFSYAGEFVTGNRQDVDLRLLDQSLVRLKQTGLSLRASFLVKPGQYLVRAVVGERDEGEVSAGNTAVEIP
jgi:VWFA-related protein